jgi:hypothetical protein
MKSFTTKELVEIRESKYYVTKERFIEYATLKFGHSTKESEKLFEEFYKFPFIHLESERALEIGLWIVEHIHETGSVDMPYSSSLEDIKVKIIYILNQEEKEVELNLIKPEDAIKYSMIIQSIGVNIKAIVKYVDDYYGKEEFKIYEGDVYHSHDGFWGGGKGNVYVVTGGKIKRLLYIKGVGYISNGKLNIDGESSYSTYAIFGKNPQYMGNIHVDINFLKDTPHEN